MKRELRIEQPALEAAARAKHEKYRKLGSIGQVPWEELLPVIQEGVLEDARLIVETYLATRQETPDRSLIDRLEALKANWTGANPWQQGYLKAVDKAIAIVREHQDELAALKHDIERQVQRSCGLAEDLDQLIRVCLTNPDDVRGFIEANYPAEYAKHAATAPEEHFRPSSAYREMVSC